MLNRFAFGTLDERTVRRRVDSLPDQGEARRKSRRVENLPDHGASRLVENLPDQGEARRKELSELDAKGLPDPISADQKKIIMDRDHDSYHQPVVAYSVCNQFCSLSATELLLPCELPPAVFSVLQPSPEAEPLSAELCGVVYSDYSYLCSSDLQTLQAYRSCNVDHGGHISHLNPPSRSFNTTRFTISLYKTPYKAFHFAKFD